MSFVYGDLQRTKILCPQCTIVVYDKKSGKEEKVDAIIDTGSSMSVIPSYIMNQFSGLTDGKPIPLKGYSGQTSGKSFPTKYIGVSLLDALGTTFTQEPWSNIRVIYFEKDYAIVGRDILNHMKIVFRNSQSWKINCSGCEH
jgi:hypothetical protein